MWLDKLLALDACDDTRFCDQDHLAFMALCFLSKQIDHTKSILVLIPSRDTILIARSMIEGLCQLLWAVKDPDVRPRQWRAFAWDHDWRLVQAKIKGGESIDPEVLKGIQDGLRRFGNQFLKERERVAFRPGNAVAAGLLP